MVISPGFVSPITSQQPLTGSGQIPALSGINTPLPGGITGATLLPGALNFAGLNSALSQSQPFLFDPSFLQGLTAPVFSGPAQPTAQQSAIDPRLLFNQGASQALGQPSSINPAMLLQGQVPPQGLPTKLTAPSQNATPLNPALLLSLLQQQQGAKPPAPIQANDKGPGKKQKTSLPPGLAKKNAQSLPPGNPFRAILEQQQAVAPKGAGIPVGAVPPGVQAISGIPGGSPMSTLPGNLSAIPIGR